MNLVANVLILRPKSTKIEIPWHALECQKDSLELSLRANHHLEMALATNVEGL